VRFRLTSPPAVKMNSSLKVGRFSTPRARQSCSIFQRMMLMRCCSMYFATMYTKARTRLVPTLNPISIWISTDEMATQNARTIAAFSEFWKWNKTISLCPILDLRSQRCKTNSWCVDIFKSCRQESDIFCEELCAELVFVESERKIAIFSLKIRDLETFSIRNMLKSSARTPERSEIAKARFQPS